VHLQATVCEAGDEEDLDVPKDINWATNPGEEGGHFAFDILDANALEVGAEEQGSKVVLADDVLQGLDLALLSAGGIGLLESDHLSFAKARSRQACSVQGERELVQQRQSPCKHEVRAVWAVGGCAREPVEVREDDRGDVVEHPWKGVGGEHGRGEVEICGARDDEGHGANVGEDDLVPLRRVLRAGDDAVEKRRTRRICHRHSPHGRHADDERGLENC
jgi:hypothetical protein